jgi:hypothetical protein
MGDSPAKTASTAAFATLVAGRQPYTPSTSTISITAAPSRSAFAA